MENTNTTDRALAELKADIATLIAINKSETDPAKHAERRKEIDGLCESAFVIEQFADGAGGTA